MKPRSKINPHTDSCNFILTSHLGLKIPPGCSITVGGPAPDASSSSFAEGVDAALPLPDRRRSETKVRGSARAPPQVGDETKAWTPGGVLLFDTSIYHDAVNDSDDTRYILMLRVWHPELTSVEVQALQFLFDVLDVPDLISDDPVKVFRAEHELAGLRTRPEARAKLAPSSNSDDAPPAPAVGKVKKKRTAKKGSGFGVPT